ncbi:MAG: hypothetical protein Q8M29_17625 [Bacteroidota bacterium]|nr:hypothetical protein [Bacteroidota bacterium]
MSNSTSTLPAPNTVAAPTTQSTATPDGGWQFFYNQLTKNGTIPNLQGTNFSTDGVNAVFRGVYYRLSDIQNMLAAQESSSKTNYDIITIYTDILEVDADVNWELNNTALVVCARIVNIENGAGFTVNMDFTGSNADTSLMIFSSQINGEIGVNSNGSSYATLSGNACATGIGINLNTTTGKAQTTTLNLYNGIPIVTITEDQDTYLNNSFICGAICSDSSPEIAFDILNWVNQWAVASFTYHPSHYTQLAFQSSSLCTLVQSELLAQQNGGHYVPFVNSTVYENLISNVSSTLSNNLTNYITLFSATQADANFIAAAQALQGIYSNEQSNYQAMFSQAQQEYQSALNAENQALLNFQLQQINVVTDGNNMIKIGIPDYKQKQSIEAAIAIGKALVEFGVGIAGMATGNEETAPAAAEGAITAVQAAKGASSVVNSMKELKQLTEVIGKMAGLAASIYDATKNLSPAGNPPSYPSNQLWNNIGGVDAINTTAAWEVYKSQFEQQIAPLVTADIEYATDYKTSMEAQIVYGKALAAAQLASYNACQKVVSAAIQVYYCNKNTSQISSLVKNLQNNQSQMEQLQQLFYKKFLNTKILLYTLMKSYEATYYYWALTPYPNPVDLINLNSLTADYNSLIDMDLANYNQLVSFSDKTPQSVPSLQVSVNMSDVLIDTTNNTATWVLHTDNPAFEELSRVRFTRLRIWLDGQNLYPANPPASGTTCKFMVTSSGNYNDVDPTGNDLLFCSARYHYQFEYTVNNKANVIQPAWIFADNSNLAAAVNMDGAMPTNMQNDFIEPTPFSQWTITLPTGSGINLSNVTSITMEIQGSAIAN